MNMFASWSGLCRHEAVLSARPSCERDVAMRGENRWFEDGEVDILYEGCICSFRARRQLIHTVLWCTFGVPRFIFAILWVNRVAFAELWFMSKFMLA